MHFEDFAVGQKFASATREVAIEETLAFAARYDPQPFHLDQAAGRASAFGGLVASGWMTASLTMRLLVDALVSRTPGMIGLGLDSLVWPNPVRPNRNPAMAS